MKSHEIEYQILGDDMQMVEIALDQNETVIAEAGAMNFMEDGISFEAKLGDGSNPSGKLIDKLMKVGERLITGESILLTHFTNHQNRKRRITFSAPYPGKIIPLNLSEIGGEILCQKDAFLCASMGTTIGIAFTKRLGTGFFGGEGFILQKLQGDGMVFVQAGGTILRRELKNETLRVDTGCIVAFSPTVDYDIELVGGLKSIVFGGEGLFLTTLKGTGTVLLQSLPFSRLANRILRHAPAAGGTRKGEGSILGHLGDLLNGD